MHDDTVDSLERTSAAHLPAAHGGELIDLYVGPERRAEIKTESRGVLSIQAWGTCLRNRIHGTSEAGLRVCSDLPAMISKHCVCRLLNCGSNSPGKAGAELSPSRPAIPCIGLMSN